jgi:NAD/NADP transhydrogenase beta subunit
MNRNALIRASVIGTGLQLAMIVAGHFIPFVRDNLFAIVGMLISLIAGLLYARAAKGKLADSLIGGAVAGGVCALIGIAASFALGDVPAMVIAFGTLSSAVTGAVGGAIGRAVFKG